MMGWIERKTWNWPLRKKLWNTYWWFKRHRIGYCEYPQCGCWTLLRRQPINRSTASAWMCEECADEEQQEVDAAWAEYYSGVL